MRELFKDLTADQANTCGLVLSSSGISYRVKQGRKGWEIWVDESGYDSALTSIKQYFKENQDDFSTPEPGEDKYHKTFTGIWAAVLLLAWYLTFMTGNDSRPFIRAYGSVSDSILRGELYRAATSLMLHADGVHLVGNMVGIAVFGTAVCSITGWGVGWLMILLTGIIGNLVNAAVLKTGHVSIGASTAIFGAIGILSGHQFIKLFRSQDRRIKAWMPLAGGVALLGFLGSGVHTDLTAHLFGFLTGLILGILYAALIHRLPSRPGQKYAICIFIGLLFFSWLTAFSHG